MDKDDCTYKNDVAGNGLFLHKFVIDNGYKGIVLEAMGRGNIPPTMVEGVKRAIKNNIPVVVVQDVLKEECTKAMGMKVEESTLWTLVLYLEIQCQDKRQEYNY